jgi:hypothetical protein
MYSSNSQASFRPLLPNLTDRQILQAKRPITTATKGNQSHNNLVFGLNHQRLSPTVKRT